MTAPSEALAPLSLIPPSVPPLPPLLLVLLQPLRNESAMIGSYYYLRKYVDQFAQHIPEAYPGQRTDQVGRRNLEAEGRTSLPTPRASPPLPPNHGPILLTADASLPSPAFACMLLSSLCLSLVGHEQRGLPLLALLRLLRAVHLHPGKHLHSTHGITTPSQTT